MNQATIDQAVDRASNVDSAPLATIKDMRTDVQEAYEDIFRNIPDHGYHPSQPIGLRELAQAGKPAWDQVQKVYRSITGAVRQMMGLSPVIALVSVDYAAQHADYLDILQNYMS